MKNSIKLILCFLFLVPAVSSAQIWYVGAKAGVTFSNYKSQTPWKEATNAGYSFGAAAYKQVRNNFGFGAELIYVQKGYYHKICNTMTDQLNATYIEVPLMADYTFLLPGLKNFKGHATLGVYTAYWASAKYKMQGFDENSEDFDFKENKASRFDFGPNAGVRLEYILKNGSLSLDFRYELGLLDLQKRVNDDTSNTNRALLIGLSYMKILNF